MSGRVKSERSETSVNLSGQLAPRLTWHAGERIKHLFLFLFAVDAACRRLSAVSGSKFMPAPMIREKASHQIDTGLRSSKDEYEDFDEKDANIVFLASTEFSRTDAAHFCNLGFTGQWQTLKLAAESKNDKATNSLIALAEVCAGNTVQLPQRVNIGPDRIIDQLHWALGPLFLAKPPVMSPGNLKHYAEQATIVLNAYASQMYSDGKNGVCACCAYYLAAYGNTQLEELYASLRGLIWSECDALGLKVDEYIA